MNPPVKLIEGLKKKNFISADDNEFDTFAELEKSIVVHVFGNRNDDSAVVRFDGECIENSNDYAYLIQQFIDAVPADLDISDIKSNYDARSNTASCAIKLGEKLEKAEWAQNSDWVAAEFIEFMLRSTVCSKGRFVVIDTGDQTFCAIFLNKGLSDALEKYRNNDSNSRESFVSEHASGNLALFDNIKILPRPVFKATLSNLRQYFNNHTDLLDPCAYKTDSIVSFVCVSDSDDALASYRKVKARNDGFTQYAAIGQYEYGSICPDETAYFLSLENLEREVIFEYPARKVGLLVGEGKSFGPYALIGKASDWAVIVNKGGFICLGAAVVDLVSDSVTDTQDNAVAGYYDRIRDDWFEPIVSRLGYSKSSDGVWNLMKHDNYWSAVFTKGSQEKINGSLNSRVIFTVFNPTIGYVYKKLKLPELPFDDVSVSSGSGFSIFGKLSWDISNDDDYQELVDNLEKGICEMYGEIAEGISLDKWIDIFSGDEDNLRAAIAAYFSGNAELTEKYILKQAEIEKDPNRFWFMRDKMKKLAKLLNVTID